MGGAGSYAFLGISGGDYAGIGRGLCGDYAGISRGLAGISGDWGLLRKSTNPAATDAVAYRKNKIGTPRVSYSCQQNCTTKNDI